MYVAASVIVRIGLSLIFSIGFSLMTFSTTWLLALMEASRFFCLYRRFAHLCEQQVVVVLCAMNSCLHHAQIRLISMLLLMLFLLISPIFLYNSVKSRKMA
jgi:hypothetical protein